MVADVEKKSASDVKPLLSGTPQKRTVKVAGFEGV
jgi:hypothetical protein